MWIALAAAVAGLISGASVHPQLLHGPQLRGIASACSGVLETCGWMRSASRAWAGTEVPRRVAYPVIGASATLAVAAGLLLVRLSPAGLGWDAMRAEVLGNVAMYLYVAIVIMAVFVGLGAALGYQTDRLVTQTTTDPLTGLHNRRALQERIDEELRRSARYGKSLSLLLIDLDKFKQVNDRYGHLAGDALLCAIGQAIQRTMRKTDYAARLGGDEFAIVSPNTGGADAALLARRVRLAIARDARRQHQLVTASIGIATYHPQESWPLDPLTLINAADAALYDAKHDNGNTFRWATSALALFAKPALKPARAEQRLFGDERF